MAKHLSVRQAVRLALLTSAIPMVLSTSPAFAQEQDTKPIRWTKCVVTGTRISVPGVVSSSPIYTVSTEAIERAATAGSRNDLPPAADHAALRRQNANNGTAGAATINLRGLGSQRNIILIDGKRITPYNHNGLVDTSIIPTAMLERVDVLTGGASTSYGSDAMSGAINFIMKRDFEGVATRQRHVQQTAESDGQIKTASITVGTNMAEGRGNIVFGVNWTERDPVMLGDRPLGQLGIVTADGGGYDQFLAGEAPTPGAGWLRWPGFGGRRRFHHHAAHPRQHLWYRHDCLGQFRDDKSLGDNCSVFNFNPFNYYQTPQTRFGGTALGHFEVNEHAEVYGRLAYSSTTVRQQIAPSGVFGSAFWTPLANPLISDSARAVFHQRCAGAWWQWRSQRHELGRRECQWRGRLSRPSQHRLSPPHGGVRRAFDDL